MASPLFSKIRVGDTAPVETDALWLDTSLGLPRLKAYSDKFKDWIEIFAAEGDIVINQTADLYFHTLGWPFLPSRFEGTLADIFPADAILELILPQGGSVSPGVSILVPGKGSIILFSGGSGSSTHQAMGRNPRILIYPSKLPGVRLDELRFAVATRKRNYASMLFSNLLHGVSDQELDGSVPPAYYTTAGVETVLFTLDMGATRIVDVIVLGGVSTAIPTGGYVRAQYSGDGVTWTQIGADFPAGDSEHLMPARLRRAAGVSARYVRVVALSDGTATVTYRSVQVLAWGD